MEESKDETRKSTQQSAPENSLSKRRAKLSDEPKLIVDPKVLAEFLALLEHAGLIRVNRRMLRLKRKS